MKLNEYINMLTELLNSNGNIEVKHSIYPQCRVVAGVKFMRIPKDKRQTAIAYFREGYDNPDQKGEKVIAI